jgi:hypothetical protein
MPAVRRHELRRPNARNRRPALRRERHDTEFEDETVLPSQYFDRIVAEPSLQPEKRLLLAVLESAVATYQRFARASSRRGRRLFGEVVTWMAAPEDEGIFAFENICAALDLDADYVRGGLARWRLRVQGTEDRNAGRYPYRRVSGARHKVSSRSSRATVGARAAQGWRVAF